MVSQIKHAASSDLYTDSLIPVESRCTSLMCFFCNHMPTEPALRSPRPFQCDKEVDSFQRNGGSAGVADWRRTPHTDQQNALIPDSPLHTPGVGVVDWTYLFLRSSLLQVSLEVAGWELRPGPPGAAALPDGCSRHECRRLGTD